MAYKLPTGWRLTCLGDVTEECKERNNGDFSWDALFAVTKAEGIVPMRERVRGKSLDRCKVVRKGEFAYNPMRLNIGSIARSRVDHPVLVSPDYVAFRCDDEKLDHQFLEYVRQSFEWRRFMEDSGSGSVRVRIYYKNLADFQFLLPPLPEQKKIAAILGSVDETIQTTQAVIDQTRKVKQGLLQQLLTRGTGHTRFKQTEIGEIPEGWKMVTLGEVVVAKGLQTGPFGSQLHASDYVDDGIPVVMPKDLRDGHIVEDSVARVPEAIAEKLSKHRVQKGDILFGRRGDIGRCGLVVAEEEGWLCGTGCLRARPADVMNPDYLIQYLRWPATVDWLNQNAVGQTMLNLNTQILTALPICLPPKDEQDKIANIIVSFDHQVAELKAELETLGTMKTGLMQDLLTGRVRVGEVKDIKAAV